MWYFYEYIRFNTLNPNLWGSCRLVNQCVKIKYFLYLDRDCGWGLLLVFYWFFFSSNIYFPTYNAINTEVQNIISDNSITFCFFPFIIFHNIIVNDIMIFFKDIIFVSFEVLTIKSNENSCNWCFRWSWF